MTNRFLRSLPSPSRAGTGTRGVTRRTLLGAGAVAPFMAGGPAAAAAPTLRLTYYEDFSPVSFRKPDGSMGGILIDTLDEMLGKRLGLTLDHEGYPWPRAQELVRTGTRDAFCTNASDARRAYATFCEEPVLTAGMAIFYAKENPKRPQIETISGLSDLSKFVQGDYRGSGLADAFKGLPIDWAPRLSSVLEKVASQRNDIFIGTDLAGLGAARQAGVRDRILCLPTQAFGAPSSYRLGIHTASMELGDVPTLCKRIDAEIRRAKEDGALATIAAPYL